MYTTTGVTHTGRQCPRKSRDHIICGKTNLCKYDDKRNMSIRYSRKHSQRCEQASCFFSIRVQEFTRNLSTSTISQLPLAQSFGGTWANQPRAADLVVLAPLLARVLHPDHQERMLEFSSMQFQARSDWCLPVNYHSRLGLLLLHRHRS